MEQDVIKARVEEIYKEFSYIVEDLILGDIEPKTNDVNCLLGMGTADEVLSEGINALWEAARDYAINPNFIDIMIKEFKDYQSATEVDISDPLNMLIDFRKELY